MALEFNKTVEDETVVDMDIVEKETVKKHEEMKKKVKFYVVEGLKFIGKTALIAGVSYGTKELIGLAFGHRTDLPLVYKCGGTEIYSTDKEIVDYCKGLNDDCPVEVPTENVVAEV